MMKYDPFNDFVIKNSQDSLVVQPRMGFSAIARMQEGLEAVKNLAFPTVGTITVDAMTRQGLVDKARDAVRHGKKLNGFPLASYSTFEVNEMLQQVVDNNFPVQVRHGTPLPGHVFDAAIKNGLTAIEGGPVSYALPYGKSTLQQTFPAWRESLQAWTEYGHRSGYKTHVESFAGCMMGQLCPPSMLIALSILEGCVFKLNGIESMSLSMAQGTNSDQDIAALIALERLSRDYLDGVSMHIVAYTWMGVFPNTQLGAEKLIKESARVARVGGAKRLIVKTVDEASGIPSIENNLNALQWCYDTSKKYKNMTPNDQQLVLSERLIAESKLIIEQVIALHADIEVAIQLSFLRGILDVPYCIHPDNNNIARATLDQNGVIGWANPGNVPVLKNNTNVYSLPLTSTNLLKGLSFNQNKYDNTLV